MTPAELMFLEFLGGAAAGSVARAARMAGMDPWMPYRLAKRDALFRKAMRREKATGDRVALDLTEEAAHQRGVEGWDDPVFSGGGQAGTVRRYDANLLMIRLKKLQPAYRDNAQLVGVQAGNVQVVVASFAAVTGESPVTDGEGSSEVDEGRQPRAVSKSAVTIRHGITQGSEPVTPSRHP